MCGQDDCSRVTGHPSLELEIKAGTGEGGWHKPGILGDAFLSVLEENRTVFCEPTFDFKTILEETDGKQNEAH